jgi:hypothetical protein
MANNFLRWLSEPGSSDMLGMMGAGLLGASGQMPAGANRMALMGPAFGQAMQAKRAGQNFALTKQLQEMQMKQAQQQQAIAESTGHAKAKIFGGYDPRNEVNWNKPRPMDAQQTSQAWMEAYPDQAAALHFAKPETRKTVMKDGNPYYIDTGQPVPLNAPPSAAFSGTRIQSQMYSRLETTAAKLDRGEKLTKSDERLYRAAHAYLSEPQETKNLDGSITYNPPPDISMFPPLPGKTTAEVTGTGSSTTPDIGITAPDKLSPADQAKFRTGTLKLDQVNSSIQNYISKLKEHGAQVIPSGNKLTLQTAYRDLLLEMKELYNLGVLNGPDLMIMEQVMIDPTSIRASVYEAFGGKEVFDGQIAQLEEKLNGAKDRWNAQYQPGAALRPPNPGATPPPPAGFTVIPGG